VCLLGHTNNVHCLAKAVNALAGALFTVHGPGDVEMRLKEFLAVSYLLLYYSFFTLRVHNVSLYLVMTAGYIFLQPQQDLS